MALLPLCCRSWWELGRMSPGLDNNHLCSWNIWKGQCGSYKSEVAAPDLKSQSEIWLSQSFLRCIASNLQPLIVSAPERVNDDSWKTKTERTADYSCNLPSSLFAFPCFLEYKWITCVFIIFRSRSWKLILELFEKNYPGFIEIHSPLILMDTEVTLNDIKVKGISIIEKLSQNV